MTAPDAHDSTVERFARSTAACITAVAGADEADVIRCFGGDPAEARHGTFADLSGVEFDSGRRYIFVSRTGSTVVVREDNGFEGTREEVLRPLSRLGRAASAFWNVNAHSRLSLAEDGLVRSSLDMLFPDDRDGACPEAWDRYLHGLDFDSPAGSTWAVGMTAVARATGAQLDTAWETGPQQIVPIRPVKEAVLYQCQEGSPLLAESPFDRYLADLGPHHLPHMRQYAFELALQHTGLDRDPLALSALAGGDGTEAGRHELRARLSAAQSADREQAFALMSGEPDDLDEDEPIPAWTLPSHVFHIRSAMWWALEGLLAAEDRAPGDSTFRPGPESLLTYAMRGPSGSAERYWLLTSLMRAAARG
ncbi:hypothetical protein FGW37_01770 [Streptomyces rectiverticillatus]|uniref:DUF6461 domain-containing protein n=1 Tax=Streptomyces rectiverticillatus TaxID=173860 RepID=UPI0015C3220F|nr:DUF6461 domain-containing protein [Streptomyces rectiverticillatus]QLE70498.1 hypothetical protein FGW37_01770 [Streptomyces rectiverticillatus]